MGHVGGGYDYDYDYGFFLYFHVCLWFYFISIFLLYCLHEVISCVYLLLLSFCINFFIFFSFFSFQL